MDSISTYAVFSVMMMEMRGYQGTIVLIHSNKSNDIKYIIAIIQWKDEFVAEGDAKPTKEMLRMKDYNPETHGNCSW